MRFSLYQCVGLSAAMLACEHVALGVNINHLDLQDYEPEVLAQAGALDQDQIKSEWKGVFDSLMMPQTWDSALDGGKSALDTLMLTQIKGMTKAKASKGESSLRPSDVQSWMTMGQVGFFGGIFLGMYKNQLAANTALGDFKKEAVESKENQDCLQSQICGLKGAVAETEDMIDEVAAVVESNDHGVDPSYTDVPDDIEDDDNIFMIDQDPLAAAAAEGRDDSSDEEDNQLVDDASDNDSSDEQDDLTPEERMERNAALYDAERMREQHHLLAQTGEDPDHHHEHHHMPPRSMTASFFYGLIIPTFIGLTTMGLSYHATGRHFAKASRGTPEPVIRQEEMQTRPESRPDTPHPMSRPDMMLAQVNSDYDVAF